MTHDARKAATPALLGLPVELRLKIYDSIPSLPHRAVVRHVLENARLYVTDRHESTWQQDERHYHATLAAIGLTCRQLYLEIDTFLYKDLHFRLHIRNDLDFFLDPENPYHELMSSVSGINALKTFLPKVEYLQLDLVVDLDDFAISEELITLYRKALKCVAASSRLKVFGLSTCITFIMHKQRQIRRFEAADRPEDQLAGIKGEGDGFEKREELVEWGLDFLECCRDM